MRQINLLLLLENLAGLEFHHRPLRIMTSASGLLGLR